MLQITDEIVAWLSKAERANLVLWADSHACCCINENRRHRFWLMSWTKKFSECILLMKRRDVHLSSFKFKKTLYRDITAGPQHRDHRGNCYHQNSQKHV